MSPPRRVLATLSVTALIAAGCSTPPSPTPTTEPSPTGFSPFDLLSIQVVRLSAAGDFSERWLAGVAFEADRLGVDPSFADAHGDPVRHAAAMQDAIDRQPQVIVVDGGSAELLQPLIGAALDAGIAVVAFGVVPGDERASEVGIGEAELVQQIRGAVVEAVGGSGSVIYAYAAGDSGIDRRHTAWEAMLAQQPTIRVAAQVGGTPDDGGDEVAATVTGALQANPGATAIFAPSGAFAAGAARAVVALGLQDSVRVYGGGITEADLAAMIAPDSPWVAAAGVDPFALGAVTFRCSVVAAQGLEVDRTISLPPVLVTQERLRSGGITNMLGLREEYPALRAENTCAVQR